MPTLRGISKLLASFLVSCHDELMDVDLWGFHSLFVVLHIYREIELRVKTSCSLYSPLPPFKMSIFHTEERCQNLVLWSFLPLATKLYISWNFLPEPRETRLGKPSELPN